MEILDLYEVKSKRDLVRNELVKALQNVPGLPEEVIALLRADAVVTQELARALTHYQGNENALRSH